MSDTYDKTPPKNTPARTPAKEDRWTFDGDVQKAPSWVDKGWAGYNAGPVLNVPRGDPDGQPYTTVVCRIGDEVVRRKHLKGYDDYTVVPGDPNANLATGPDAAIQKPGQETAASLEDLVANDAVELTKDDLNEEAKAQLEARSPRFKDKDDIILTPTQIAEKKAPAPPKEHP